MTYDDELNRAKACAPVARSNEDLQAANALIAKRQGGQAAQILADKASSGLCSSITAQQAAQLMLQAQNQATTGLMREPAKISSRSQLLDSIRSTFSKGLAIVEKKGHDYAAGDDPFRTFRMSTLLGVTVERAILIRIMDKLGRINSLLDHPAQVKDESISDTLIDAINYLAILKAFREMEGGQGNAC